MVLRLNIGSISHIVKTIAVNTDRVKLCIKAEPYNYHFSVIVDGEIRSLGAMETRYLSSEVAGGFTGVMIGMYAVDECGKEAVFTNLALEHREV